MVLRCFLSILLALALVGSRAASAEVSAGAIRPLPDYSELALPEDPSFTAMANGELAWLGQQPIGSRAVTTECPGWEIVMTHWNPASGTIRRVSVEPAQGGFVYRQLPMSAGLLALTQCKSTPRTWRFLLLPTGGGAPLSVETDEALDPFELTLLALGKDAAALVTRDKDGFIKVYTIRREGTRLALAQQPALRIPYRRDFAAVAPRDDQVMILGGSNSHYRGCSPCRAETHVLDLKTGLWHIGPSMREARSELAATVLPDGGVLVSGGWTAAADWNGGPSRTAERWDPLTNKFEPVSPMPTGNALHRYIWWTAPWGRTLLSVQGMAAEVHAFDPATRTWRTVGEWRQGSEEGGCGFWPFVIDGNAYAWKLDRTEGAYSTRSCEEQNFGTLSLLRPPAGAAPSLKPPPESSLVTYRSGSAFLPAAASAPALVIGGTAHAGMNRAVASVAVEAIGTDGRATTWPSLPTARWYAHAFRIAGGVMVVGGEGPDTPFGGQRDRKPLPTVWLPAPGTSPWSWREVTAPAMLPGTATALLPDDSMLAVEPSGDIHQLRLAFTAGKLVFESTSLPGLLRNRRPGATEGDEVRVQALKDGRIVVAGGDVQTERIALYSELVSLPDQPDQYVGIGDYLPSRRHEIFDPATRRWTNSAPSRAAGGRAFILADGRVVKAGKAQSQGTFKPDSVTLEISNPAGTGWTSLALAGSRMRMNERYRLFSIDGELFASGEMEGVDTGGGPSGVEWFNGATLQWESLWQAAKGDNWRDHRGRFLVRTVGGKTVVIPVEGP